ncbi:MAG: TrkH family potassium uptake protein [Sphaerochaetaceae bacterium]|nr:TrkH family potassium uptake protein [Sphaerochaetaceae bacterium]
MDIRKDAKLLALIQIFTAILMVVPLLVSLSFNETEVVKAFIKTIALILVVSITTLILTRKADISTLKQRDGFFFVTFTWIIAAAFGAIPLVLSGDYPNYSFAFFEVMSGFTTTGATCLSDIECCHKGILFWRSMTNWLGGMGIVVLFMALLPALGAGANLGASSFQLLGAESVGPVKGKLTPKTKTTALVLWGIYIGFSLLETVLLLFGGLNLYDAITVTFSSIATAGFCVKNASIGAFNSAYVDTVVMIFMLIAGINFSLYYKAFTGKLKSVLKDSELRCYLFLWLIASLLVAIQLTGSSFYNSFAQSFRYASFHIASIMTTTGFSTTEYMAWPSFSIMLLVIMMFVGGCAGSTGGGIKVTRIQTMAKLISNNLKKKIHPSSVSKIRIGKDIVHDDTVTSIAAFCAMYFFTWFAGTLILTLTGQGLDTCMSASLLSIGNIGLGIGRVSPSGNFSIFPNWALWVCSFEMLLGRLELFTVYVLFSKSFWKK